MVYNSQRPALIDGNHSHWRLIAERERSECECVGKDGIYEELCVCVVEMLNM